MERKVGRKVTLDEVERAMIDRWRSGAARELLAVAKGLVLSREYRTVDDSMQKNMVEAIFSIDQAIGRLEILAGQLKRQYNVELSKPRGVVEDASRRLGDVALRLERIRKFV